nr:immunoglobulin heavy chain junction region [Macaca mulatta]
CARIVVVVVSAIQRPYNRFDVW